MGVTTQSSAQNEQHSARQTLLAQKFAAQPKLSGSGFDGCIEKDM